MEKVSAERMLQAATAMSSALHDKFMTIPMDQPGWSEAHGQAVGASRVVYALIDALYPKGNLAEPVSVDAQV